MSPEPVILHCDDGIRLQGHLWHPKAPAEGLIILNAATGVPARWYHRYAAFLAQNGFRVLTWDYRGVGLSRPPRLRGCGYRWRDWGEKDFHAVLRFMQLSDEAVPLIVIGHSIGGFLPGLACNAGAIDAMLTVGAQYAWAGDYAPRHRLRLWLKWHLVMPVLTGLCGWFPGRALGWLEDLPKGVALEWAFRRARFELSHPRAERKAVLARLAAVRAEILAVAVSDDDLGTVPALRRALSYYTGAGRSLVRIHPGDYGRDQIGHFDLFHDRHKNGFWRETLAWLHEGHNPWADRLIDRMEPRSGQTEC
ncbi:alpha/beta fold hydrolase [Pseudomonas sp. GX19020]|uniref:alpha/beta hydrolase family protein n=1 Tax=Pseudomonas sp. GX19020 TaxID=2942277 RepID=UPI0020193630|nr:alpha/beta fold hydrolase [Pseudomonas sp. GX19020]MCL4065844.1 alpha/beta fold hydrolase [Pseudomonas sp. GX19020]